MTTGCVTARVTDRKVLPRNRGAVRSWITRADRREPRDRRTTKRGLSSGAAMLSGPPFSDCPHSRLIPCLWLLPANVHQTTSRAPRLDPFFRLCYPQAPLLRSGRLGLSTTSSLRDSGAESWVDGVSGRVGIWDSTVPRRQYETVGASATRVLRAGDYCPSRKEVTLARGCSLCFFRRL